MKRCFTLFLFTGLFTLCFAQDYDDQNSVAIPAPHNNFLDGASQVGINLYTGAPEIGIPIFTLPSKTLPVSISLAYVKANGIKVQDVANVCGLGWQLNGGGGISRVVRSLPDEHPKGYVGTGQSGKAILHAITTNSKTEEFERKIGKGEIDGEPDIFNITTPFFSFQFVLDENGNAVVPNNKGIKITHNLYNNGNYQNTSWVVTDDKGNQYYFGTFNTVREQLSTKLFETDYTFNITWYLEKIVSYNKKEEISFYYTSGGNYNYKHYLKSKTVFTTTHGTCPPPNATEIKDLTQTFNFIAPKYLSSIQSSIGVVQFHYDFNRADLLNAARLTSITIVPGTSSGPALKTLRFNYSYFVSSSNSEGMRLKLDNITLAGSSTALPMTYKSFDYYTEVMLPERTSVEFDYMGYYNVNTSGTTLVCDGANKQPNEARTKANVLKSITDRSGTVDKIEYESNTFWDNASNSNVQTAGLRVRKMSSVLPSGQTTYTEYSYVDNNGRSTGQVYKNSYNRFSRQVYFFSGIHNNDNCVIQGHNYISESILDGFDMNGPFVGYSAVKTQHQNGGYEISYFTNFSDFPDGVNWTNVPSGSQPRQLGSHTSLLYKRGLLTKKTTHKSNGDIIDETLHTYTSLTGVTAKAFGIKAYPSQNVVLGGSGYTVWIDSYYNANVESYMLTKTVSKVYDQYDQNLFQDITTDYSYAPSNRLIRSITTTDTKGNTAIETTYYPEDVNIPNITANEQAALNTLVAANVISLPVHTVRTVNGTAAHTHYSYKNMYDGNLNTLGFLASTTKYVDNNLAEEQVNKQEFEYNASTLHVASTQATNDIVKSVHYGYNNSMITAIVTNAQNKSSISISQGTGQTSLYIMPGDNSTLVEPIRVGFTGSITFKLEFESNDPSWMVSSVNYYLSGPANYSGSLCVSNNNDCNNTTVTINNVAPGNYTLNVYPVTTQYPPVQNVVFYVTYPANFANYTATNEFYYEGFEEHFHATTASPWAGKRCYRGDYTIQFAKPNNREYVVDYHYLQDGKWHAATKPFTDYMVLTDGYALDEIRVYPKDATMKTYTNSPLLGVTSECDENNRFTFYEYDDLGRLVLIRDNDKNIVKKVCYNYAGEDGGCFFFSSEARSQTFTKNNCVGDAIGNPVTVSVPAGRFFSAVSQADANQQADSYLFMNGQDEANRTGTCTPVFFNQHRWRYLYSQNCPPETAPEPYYYEVPARKYYSFNNLGEANAMADHEIDTEGQQEANTLGTCKQSHVRVQYNTGSNVYNMHVRFRNVNTGQEYEFALDPGTSGQLPPIPIATYDIHIYDIYQSGYNYYFEFCTGYSDWGTAALFEWVEVSPDCATLNVNR